jgi:hypothetical protein
MAYSVSSSVTTTKFDQRTDALKDTVLQAAKEASLNTAKAGISLGERLIELRGTKGSKARFAGEYLPAAGPGNSDGRNDTGEMSDALLAEVTAIDGYNTRVEVGWLGNDFQPYFGYQELGFTNWKAWDWRSGTFRNRKEPTYTEGMFIFRDIKTLIRKIHSGQVSQAVSREVKKIK